MPDAELVVLVQAECCTTAPTCRMRPGEIRRLPQNLRAGLLGYYVRCRCDWRNVALARDHGIEEADGEVSFAKPIECLRCHRLVAVTKLRIVGDPGVRCCRSAG